MELATFIERQMESVRDILGGLVEGVTHDEWVGAAAPGLNPVGFTAWHVPSIQDWAINTWMRNRPTVRERPEWTSKGMMTSFLPIGVGLDGAQAIAAGTEPADVLAYADAVLEEARRFLGTFSPSGFDELPPNRGHLADQRYASAPGYMADVGGMFEQRYWRVFAGACTAHCRGHLGELENALAVLRAR
jgi:hypothetical protein